MISIPLHYQLAAYIAHRAEAEGTYSELSPEFFRRMLRVGIRNFFGVSVTRARILKDHREPTPGFLDRFLAELPKADDVVLTRAATA